MTIAPIRYEFHQPPLYYVLAVPVYRLFGGSLLPLRLLSVALGALLLLVVCWTVRALVPKRPFLALGATAFVAFLPMHLAMTAAVNNDTLAELILATILLLTIRYLKLPGGNRGEGGQAPADAPGHHHRPGPPRKVAATVALPLVLVAIVLRHVWLESRHPRAPSNQAVYLFLPSSWPCPGGCAISPSRRPRFPRPPPPQRGRRRPTPDRRVHCRPRPAQTVTGFFLTSFRSFWGQFGWMGVLLDSRIYQALAIFSAIALVGFCCGPPAPGAAVRPTPIGSGPRGLLASAPVTLASYLWYNADFVQHQGRYLFPALLPLGLAVALGWREALRRERALPLAAVLLVGAAALRLAGCSPTGPC